MSKDISQGTDRKRKNYENWPFMCQEKTIKKNIHEWKAKYALSQVFYLSFRLPEYGLEGLLVSKAARQDTVSLASALPEG